MPCPSRAVSCAAATQAGAGRAAEHSCAGGAVVRGPRGRLLGRFRENGGATRGAGGVHLEPFVDALGERKGGKGVDGKGGQRSSDGPSDTAARGRGRSEGGNAKEDAGQLADPRCEKK